MVGPPPFSSFRFLPFYSQARAKSILRRSWARPLVCLRYCDSIRVWCDNTTPRVWIVKSVMISLWSRPKSGQGHACGGSVRVELGRVGLLGSGGYLILK